MIDPETNQPTIWNMAAAIQSGDLFYVLSSH